MSKIEWCDKTWNPMVGCTPAGPGCDNCYAAKMWHRQKHLPGYGSSFAEVCFFPERLDKPMKTKQPTRWFVNSMSDFFHEDITDDQRDQVMDVIRQCPQHIFQILTKRAPNMVRYFSGPPVPENVWLGVTVENRGARGRINHLRKVECSTRFVSFEPLLEDPGDVNLDGIHWIIVGGESGNSREKVRRMEPAWV